MSRQNFFMQILDNIKQEMNKNKEMKVNSLQYL